MSNAVIPANLTIPAHLRDRVGVGKTTALGAAMTGGISKGADYPRISLKGSRFRIVEDGTEVVLPDTWLHIVVIGANPRLSKTFYAEAWTPDSDTSAPDCYSLDGIRPADDASSKQNDICAGCPQDAWGAKVTDAGTQIKACSDQKRLAIIAADDPSGPIYLLQVTPAALKGLSQYHKELSARGIAPDIVKTKIEFDTAASFPKLKFSFAGFLDEETQTVVDTLFNTPKVKEITGEVEVAPVQPAQAAPAQAAPAKAATKAAENDMPDIPDAFKRTEPTPEPAAPKRGFGAKAAAEEPAEPAKAAKGFGKKAAAAKAPAKAAEPEPDAAKVAASSALADEIAGLIGEEADDAGA
ncbi:MAG: hypothetical protein JW395_0563 [Nitrospira sp.]|nr:hypothetical protein [Nitrospira sp.]